MVLYITEIMADMDGIKEELVDTEVKEEKQDLLSLEPILFPGKYIN